MKKTIRNLTLWAILSGSSLASADLPPMAEWIPADSLFFMETGSWEGISAAYQQSPFAEQRDHPLMKQLRDKISETMEELDTTLAQEVPGLTTSDLRQIFEGRFGMAMTRLPDLAAFQSMGPDGPELATFLDGFFFYSVVGERREQVANTLGLLQQNIEEDTPEFDEFGEIELLDSTWTTILPHPDDGHETVAIFGFEGDVFVFGIGVESFTRQIESLRAGRDGASLAAQASYLPIADLARQSDAFFYLDLQKLISAGLTMAHPLVEQLGFLQQFGMTFDQTVQVLGLGVINHLYYTGEWRDDEIFIEAGFGYGAKEGLLSLMAYERATPSLSPLVPGSAFQSGTFHFNLETFWTNLIDLIGRLNPEMQGMVAGGLGMVGAQFGIDIENGFIRALGTESFSASLMGQDETGDNPMPIETIIGVRLRNAEAFTELLNGIRQLADPEGAGFFRDLEFLGATLTTIVPPFFMDEAESEGFHFTILDDHFIFGIGSLLGLQEVVRLQSGQGGSRFIDDPSVQNSLAQIEGLPAGVTITRLGEGAGAFIDQIIEMAELTGQSGEIPDVLRDPLLKELLSLLFANIRSVFYEEPDGLKARYYIEYPQP